MCNQPHIRSFLLNFPIIILANLVLLFDSTAQTFSFQQYTSEDGLPGTTIYSLDQDEDGII